MKAEETREMYVGHIEPSMYKFFHYAFMLTDKTVRSADASNLIMLAIHKYPQVAAKRLFW
uniref:Uncharacterized protein n=1 Tax=Arundo donax TaxID=35708 RepID=A0A0A8XYY2_ARUDO